MSGKSLLIFGFLGPSTPSSHYFLVVVLGTFLVLVPLAKFNFQFKIFGGTITKSLLIKLRATCKIFTISEFHQVTFSFQIVAGGVCVGSLYWTCVTYGAVTLMQVVGHKQGLIFMERADPLFLLVSLPLLPVSLVLGKMIRWEEPVSILKY